MNNSQAKQLIGLLSQRWGFNPNKLIFEIIDELERGSELKSNLYNGFEFSLVSGQKKIRILHLNFLKEFLSLAQKEKLRKKRIDCIAKIFVSLNNSSCKFNDKIKPILSIAKSHSWMVQFGIDLAQSKIERVKIYFTSPDGLKLQRKKVQELIKKLSCILNLKADKLEKTFKNKDFDTVGIDFLPRGECFLKIYPLICKGLPNPKEVGKVYQPVLSALRNMLVKETGMLCRISPSSDISSTKLWFRLKESVAPKRLNILKQNFPKQKLWLKESFKIIKDVEAKISYFALENRNLGIYFR